jgi:hypothetical protein
MAFLDELAGMIQDHMHSAMNSVSGKGGRIRPIAAPSKYYPVQAQPVQAQSVQSSPSPYLSAIAGAQAGAAPTEPPIPPASPADILQSYITKFLGTVPRNRLKEAGLD